MRRGCCILICAFLLLGLGGCRRDVTDMVETEENSDGTLSERYGIPVSYSGEIEDNINGITSISIDAEEICVPDTESMCIVYATKYEDVSEYKKKIAEAIFDKGTDIFEYDRDNLSKKDMQYEIAYMERDLKFLKENGTVAECEQLEKSIESFKKKLDSAPGRRMVEDYSLDDYIGVINGQEYLLSFMSGKQFILSYWPSIMTDFRPCKEMDVADVKNVNIDNIDIEELGNTENQCELTQEQAEDEARKLLYAEGISDISCERCRAIVWEYYDDSGKKVTEIDGYSFTFARAIDGVSVWNKNLGRLDQFNMDYYDGSVNMSADKYEIEICNQGIVSEYFVCQAAEVTATEKRVKLLSWDEIIEKLKLGVEEYYTENKTRYSDIVFNHVSLTYFRVANGNDGFKYIPAWTFETLEDIEDGPEYVVQDALTQLIVIDAVTGNIVNLEEEIAESMNSD